MNYCEETVKHWWMNPHIRPRQVLRIDWIRYPDAWGSLTVPERCEHITSLTSPLKLLCVPDRQSDRRCDFLAVDYRNGERCALECCPTGIRLWRRSAFAAWEDMTLEEPPIECPTLHETFERWFTRIDRRVPKMEIPA